jgi:nitrate reductase gamma subunit
MTERVPQLWPRLAAYAAGSAVIWIVAIGAVVLYTRRMFDDDVRLGAPTDADSLGLPILSLAVLLAIVLLAANLVVAGILIRRRRTQSDLVSRPAA